MAIGDKTIAREIPRGGRLWKRTRRRSKAFRHLSDTSCVAQTSELGRRKSIACCSDSGRETPPDVPLAVRPAPAGWEAAQVGGESSWPQQLTSARA